MNDFEQALEKEFPIANDSHANMICNHDQNNKLRIEGARWAREWCDESWNDITNDLQMEVEEYQRLLKLSRKHYKESDEENTKLWDENTDLKEDLGNLIKAVSIGKSWIDPHQSPEMYEPAIGDIRRINKILSSLKTRGAESE